MSDHDLRPLAFLRAGGVVTPEFFCALPVEEQDALAAAGDKLFCERMTMHASAIMNPGYRAYAFAEVDGGAALAAFQLRDAVNRAGAERHGVRLE